MANLRDDTNALDDAIGALNAAILRGKELHGFHGRQPHISSESIKFDLVSDGAFGDLRAGVDEHNEIMALNFEDNARFVTDGVETDIVVLPASAAGPPMVNPTAEHHGGRSGLISCTWERHSCKQL